MTTVARLFLYFQVMTLLLFGLTGLFALDLISGQLGLAALAINGSSELRGLLGGGFIAFALIILFGLRSPQRGTGFLISMILLMAGIVLGRIVSLALDGFDPKALGAGVIELLIALACWQLYRSRAATGTQA